MITIVEIMETKERLTYGYLSKADPSAREILDVDSRSSRW
jgi:hypothetical protein